jgi:hypothetical protein
MKLRCSNGFVVDSYYGIGSPSVSPDEIEFSGIDREVTSCFSLRQTSSVANGEPMYLQLAILYTSLPSSQRIVRVHNLQLYCSTDPSVVFKHADVDSLVTYFTKLAVATALQTPPQTHTISRTSSTTLQPSTHEEIPKPSAKEYQLYRTGTPRNPKANISQYLLDSCLDILLKYRQICSSHSPKGQLILPEALKILPLYTLCLMKHPVLLQNNITGGGGGGGTKAGGTIPNKADRLGVDVCERSAELNRFLRCSPQEILRSLYPRLFPLHRLQEGDGYQSEDMEEYEVCLVHRWVHLTGCRSIGWCRCQLG